MRVTVYRTGPTWGAAIFFCVLSQAPLLVLIALGFGR